MSLKYNEILEETQKGHEDYAGKEQILSMLSGSEIFAMLWIAGMLLYFAGQLLTYAVSEEDIQEILEIIRKGS